jgi:acetyl-CoA decarbonylase/synthase complex subunit delta
VPSNGKEAAPAPVTPTEPVAKKEPEPVAKKEPKPEVEEKPKAAAPAPVPETEKAPTPPVGLGQPAPRAALPAEADLQTIAQMSADIVVASIRRALEAALRELGGTAPAPTVTAAPPAPVEVVAPVAPPVVEKVIEAPEPVLPPKVERKVEPAPPPWTPEKETSVELVKEKWTGQVREVTLGATASEGGTRTTTVTVGGQTTLPFLSFEGENPHKPVVAIEIQDRKPDDWSPLLVKAWGDVMNDPGEWAKAAERAGANLIVLQLSLTDADGKPNTPEKACAAVDKVLKATGLPLIVLGPGQVDADNELLVAIADATKGERLVLGLCEDKNYRTIVAAALANGHLVVAKTAMDVNLAKQLNILISDMGLPPDRILMDPTCAGVGYGMEYGYSVMERLRLAALQGDSMTQLPMSVTVGFEAWRQKESKVGEGVPKAWGDWEERALNWETVTAAALIESAADIVVLRHPDSVRRIQAMIEQLSGEVKS